MGFDAADLLAGLFDAPAVPAAVARVPELATPEAVVPTDRDHAADGEQQDLFGVSPKPAGPFADWVMAPDTRGRIGLQSPDAPVPWPAWEDLPVWSDSTPAEPKAALAAPAAPCYWCGRREWWRSIHGPVVCGHCHPPAVPGLVAEWLGKDEKAKTE
jgi:hypothetical protein